MKLKNLYLILFSFLIGMSCESSNQEKTKDNINESLLLKHKIIDLSHDYSKETIYWVTAKQFDLDTVFAGQTENGFYYAANNFSTAEHGGTHIDAPIHFAKHGQTVEEIPLESLMGPAIKIDVSQKALDNRDYLISVDDLKDWEAKQNTEIPEGSIILLETGYSKFYPDHIKYMGTDQRGEEAVELLHFPGLSQEAAKWLTENRSIKAIGIDTPSIDYGQSKLFKAHVVLLSNNIPAFENLTNLDLVPETDFQIIALPMKIKGGSGAPLRAIALVSN